MTDERAHSRQRLNEAATPLDSISPTGDVYSTVCLVPDFVHSCALFSHSAVQTVLRLNTEMLSCVTKHRNGDRQEYVLKTSSKCELHRVSESRDTQKV